MTLALIVAIPVRRIDRRPWLKIIGDGRRSKCDHIPAHFTDPGTYERVCTVARCARKFTVKVEPASDRFPNKFTARWTEAS